MAQTNKNDFLHPELVEEAVQAALGKENAFMGSLAASLGIVKINDSFGGGADNIGDLVTVPQFSAIGRFEKLADGASSTTKKITQSKEQAQVTRGTLSFEMTRWARSGFKGTGGSDPYEEIARQVVAQATEYMDEEIMAAAVTGTEQLVVDKYNSSTPRNLDWDLLVDAKSMFRDFQSDIAAIAIHSRTQGDLSKLKDTTGRPLLTDPVGQDGVARIMGYPVIVSDRLPVDNSAMTAVTATGTTPPTITLSNTTGFTGAVRPVDLRIECTLAGARGTWKFRWSLDGGSNWTENVTSAATVDLVDPLDPVAGSLLGITLNIATGNAAVDNVWTAKSILKHTSLILKRNSLAFWYNRAALSLQTVPVPQNDSVIGAMHCYSVAHRYKRVNGTPLPGVVKIRHNAGGL